ncbi:MAG: hypothetical protein ACPG7F_12440 [Aggregatilineales bacterium]
MASSVQIPVESSVISVPMLMMRAALTSPAPTSATRLLNTPSLKSIPRPAWRIMLHPAMKNGRG